MSTVTPKDGAEHWVPNMPAPTHVDVVAFQRRINAIVGTHDGRSIIKLAWAPAEFRWYPYIVGTEPRGYTFPIFHAYTDAEGNFVAAPRWVLLERFEPEQYARGWEETRFSVYDGSVWDWKGPCPSERYLELRCHTAHDGTCCPCVGDTCKCGTDYDHCWGRYLDPNERLLDWVRVTYRAVEQDGDVAPLTAANAFEAPRAQQQLKSSIISTQQAEREANESYANYMLSHWQRKPHSVSRTTASGLLYLPD